MAIEYCAAKGVERLWHGIAQAHALPEAPGYARMPVLERRASDCSHCVSEPRALSTSMLTFHEQPARTAHIPAHPADICHIAQSAALFSSGILCCARASIMV